MSQCLLLRYLQSSWLPDQSKISLPKSDQHRPLYLPTYFLPLYGPFPDMSQGFRNKDVKKAHSLPWFLLWYTVVSKANFKYQRVKWHCESRSGLWLAAVWVYRWRKVQQSLPCTLPDLISAISLPWQSWASTELRIQKKPPFHSQVSTSQMSQTLFFWCENQINASQYWGRLLSCIPNIQYKMREVHLLNVKGFPSFLTTHSQMNLPE